MYKLAKVRERTTYDLDQLKCIKDEDNQVLLEETLDRDDNHASVSS